MVCHPSLPTTLLRDRFAAAADDRHRVFGAAPYEPILMVYDAVNALAFSSHTEEPPHVMLEAQANTTPAVVTHVESVRIQGMNTGIAPTAAHDTSLRVS